MEHNLTSGYPIDDIRNREGILSRTFSALKWVLALPVVANHFFRITDLEINGNLLPLESYPGLATFMALFSSFLTNYSVPVYFFMSGYLLSFNKNQRLKPYFSKFCHRVVRLLTPLVVWSFLAMLITLGLMLIHNSKNGSPIEMPPFYVDGSFSLTKFLISLLGLNGFPDYNVPLWYLRDLTIAIAAIPLVHFILKFLDWKIFLSITAAIYIFFFTGNTAWRPEIALFFFYAGHLLRHHNINILSLFGKIAPYSLILYPILALANYFLVDTEYGTIGMILKNINICLCVPLFIYGASLLVKAGWLISSEFLSSTAFILFVAHYPLMHFFKSVVYRTNTPEEGSAWGTIDMFIAYALLIATLTLLNWILLRFTPRLMRLLTGNR